jgi:hypothetical protein
MVESDDSWDDSGMIDSIMYFSSTLVVNIYVLFELLNVIYVFH